MQMWQLAGHRPTKSWTKMCFFLEKKCVDHTTFAVRMTG